MKIRSDFVTNSSSSSFIINKIEKSEQTELYDEAFNIVKNYFIEYIKKFEEMRKHLEKFGFKFVDGEFYDEKGRSGWEDRYDILNCELKDKYGLDMYEGYFFSTDWTECNDYEEYSNFFDDEDDMPFELLDFRFKTNGVFNSADGIACYYIQCFDDIISEEKFDVNKCEKCFMKMFCPIQKDDINKLKSFSKEEITLSNIGSLLGKIVISSENNRIPDYVVNKLMNDCKYYCLHM